MVTRAIAGLLCLCVAVLAGWILFVDEPFGGEPMVVVSAPRARRADEGERQRHAAKPKPPAALDGDKPRIQDRHHHRRLDRQAAGGHGRRIGCDTRG